MQDINKVFVIGRLTKDLGSDPNGRDFGYLQNGTCKAQVSIAVNESKKGQDGQWQDVASYFDVTIWGKTAENLKPYLLKGSQIAVEGRLRQDRWQDAQGNNKSRIVINAETVQLVGGKKEGGQQTTQNQSSYAQQYQNQQNNQHGGRTQSTPQNQPINNQQGGFKEDIPWDSSNDYPSDIPF